MPDNAADRPAMTRYVKHGRGAGNHHKFATLARLLNCTRPHAYGITGRMWDWVDEHHPNGDLSGLTNQQITDAIGLDTEHDADMLIDAWVGAGLMDRTHNTLKVHNWSAPGRSGEAWLNRSKRGRKGSHVTNHVKAGVSMPATCDECKLEEIAKQSASTSALRSGSAALSGAADSDSDSDLRAIRSLRSRMVRDDRETSIIERSQDSDR